MLLGGIGTAAYLCSMDKLPYDYGNDEYRDANVRRDEIRRVPVPIQKYIKAGNQGDDGGTDEPIPCRKWLER